MRKMMKRAFSIVLVLALVLSLAACGGKNGGSNEGGKGNGGSGSAATGEAAKQYVFRGNEINMGSVGADFNARASKIIDGTVYMVGADWVDGQETLELISMDTDGGNVKNVVLDNPNVEQVVQDGVVEEVVDDEISIDGPMLYGGQYEYVGYNFAVISEDGHIYAQRTHHIDNYETNESVHENFITCWDLDGSFLWESETEPLESEDNWRYVMSMVALKDGGAAVILSGETLSKIVCDKDGNVSPSVDMKDDALTRINGIYTGKDDVVLAVFWDAGYEKCQIAELDVVKGTLGEAKPFPQNLSWEARCMTGGYDTDLALSTENGVFTYNLGDSEATKVMDFIDSDYLITGLNNLVMIDKESFIGIFYSSDDWRLKYYKFNKVDPKDVKDKTVLTLAGFYINQDVRKQIVNYNLSSNDYRFTLKDYSQYNNENDYMAGYTKLNNDIIAGNCPDILMINSNIPYESYAKKGLFANIDDLIEKDPEISQDGLLQNVLDAYRIDGKLYQIFNTFTIQTMMAKTKWVGDMQTWTVKDMLAVLDRMPEGATAFGETTRDNVLYDAMTYSISDFLDVQSGKCSFNSPEFIDLLEYIKTQPAEYDPSYWEDYDWTTYETMYREDRALLASRYVSDINDLKYVYNQNFGEDIEFIGFPTDKGTGSVISTDVSYAISAKSVAIDEAWKIVRYNLTDDYFGDTNNYYYGLPIREDILKQKIEDSTKRPYWVDEEGNKNEYDDYITINGEEVISEPFSQQMADKIYDFITSVTKTRYYNDEINNIISEEAAPFFAGQKSASDVANIIQSRIQIYVNENN